MISQASCKNLWQKFSTATQLRDQAQVALKNAGTESFESDALADAVSKVRVAFAEYQKEAAKLVKLPDGRQIQQRDYLALRRFVEGCESWKFGKQELWEEVSKVGQGKSNGITLSEEGGVIGLKLTSCELTHLGDLEGINGLNKLWLEGNALTSVEIPVTLTNLQELWLRKNHLTNIRIPPTCTNLHKLWLGGNYLTSIEIPATLTNLRELSLECNQLSSIRIPCSFTNLNMLWLGDNRLTSIEIPDTLINLVWLWLEGNSLTSIHIPVTLTKLRSLLLHKNRLTSIDIPETLTNLQELGLKDSPELTTVKVPQQCKADVFLGSCPKLCEQTKIEANLRNGRPA